MKRSFANIILIGFSGTGKSTVARDVARRLGWVHADTDDDVVRKADKHVSQIFSQDGEEVFRDMENRALRAACRRQGQVIATGGGAVLMAENREIMKQNGLVVWLEASPKVVYQRLTSGAEFGSYVVRPLLAGEEPLQKINALKEARASLYGIADITVNTDLLSLDEVGQEVIEGWMGFQRHDGEIPIERQAAEVVTAGSRYPILVGWGTLDTLGDRLNMSGLAGRAIIITDSEVGGIYGHRVRKSVEKAGHKALIYSVPAGEHSKNLEQASRIYDFLVEHRVERRETVVALGGGVVGDLAGFIAATFNPGLPFVQVPTSLMGMVDASIGGKVAVNHPRAKNLIGSFYQPRLVLADLQVLLTLPARERVSGWAEVIKHGLIYDPDFVNFLEKSAARLLACEPGPLVEAVARSAAIKAAVVSEDEKEAGGRIILNYGHTVAHGIEAASGYLRFLHGEAVAVGMVAAGRISREIGLLDEMVEKRQSALLQAFGLPVSVDGVNMEHVRSAIGLDKKAHGGNVRWVLLEDIGRTIIRPYVSESLVTATLNELIR